MVRSFQIVQVFPDLTVHETVVTAGQYRLKPGTTVEVVPGNRKDMVQNATTASAGMLP